MTHEDAILEVLRLKRLLPFLETIIAVVLMSGAVLFHAASQLADTNQVKMLSLFLDVNITAMTTDVFLIVLCLVRIHMAQGVLERADI